MKYQATFPGLLLLLIAGRNPMSAGDFDHSHQLYDQVLKRFVRDERVDYRALKADRKGLDDYLGRLASVSEPEFKAWKTEQQIAYLANLYNAATLRLIIDHYPVKSIKDIGGWLSGPWKQPAVDLFGRKITLDDLEHGILRKKYDEPRLHFALVCAAKGCPPLREEPYVADRLDGQLEDQGRKFLSSREKNSIDPGEHSVHLSPIFKWFASDFEKKEKTVLEFVLPYFPEAESESLKKAKFRVEYTDYDWSLNDSSGAKQKE